MLKSDWEKTDHIISIDDNLVEKIVQNALAESKLKSFEIISGGCINLNIKLHLEKYPSLLLRIYLRDKDIVFKEENILNLLKEKIPAPRILSTGEVDSYQFSIMEYIDGISLNNTIISNMEDDFSEVMNDLGKALGKLQDFQFEKEGNLKHDLEVIPYSEGDDIINYAYNCLEKDYTKSCFNGKEIDIIKNYINTNKKHIPCPSNPSLVHGDYDPANILVKKHNNIWKIAGILDWEFASSGSFLQDIANMLRYSHKLPKYMEEEFLKGVKSAGISLPSNWKNSIDILNLISLLDCLIRYDPSSRPKRKKDILELIKHIVSHPD